MHTFTYKDDVFDVYDVRGLIVYTKKVVTYKDILEIYDVIEEWGYFGLETFNHFTDFFRKLLWNHQRRFPIRDLEEYRTKVPVRDFHVLFD